MSKKLYTPFENCGHKEIDGTCSHPGNMTPECHQHICPISKNSKGKKIKGLKVTSSIDDLTLNWKV